VDLHAHSTASDGALSPAAVVAAARAAGLAALALTDHDTVAGVAEAADAAAAVGMRLVPGVELSAFEGDEEIHVLGLHLARIAELERGLVSFRVARRDRAVTIVERLNALGVPLSLDAVLGIAGAAALGRPHVARALVAAGHVRDFREAFDRYLGNGRPAFVAKSHLTLADAISMLHRAGGLAIIAHPGPLGTRRRVEGWMALGADGVEVRHPGHSPDDTARLGALVEHLGLVPSGGSDWHGAATGPRTIGAMQVPHAWLERQETRLSERAERGRVA
jgi:predicted metal-dependent phosphoesterase TrpH